MRVFLLFIILFFKPNLSSFDLYDLDFRDDYLNSGKKLMNLGFGLHDLEPKSKTKEILIGIHGADSRGFEWIYPLQKIDNEKINTYFFRWDTSRCAKESIEGFISAIKDKAKANKKEVTKEEAEKILKEAQNQNQEMPASKKVEVKKSVAKKSPSKATKPKSAPKKTKKVSKK